jgi:hypothetical protein
MSIITIKIQDLAEMMREMSDTLDAESAETPLLDTPHEAPPVWITNLVVEDESEKWQKRANDHINLLTHVVYSVASLAVLAAIWVCLLAWSNIGGFLIHLGGMFVVSAVLSVIAQQRIKRIHLCITTPKRQRRNCKTTTNANSGRSFSYFQHIRLR